MKLRHLSFIIAISLAACSGGSSLGTSPTTAKGSARAIACVASIANPNACPNPASPPTPLPAVPLWPGAIADGNFSKAEANFWDVAAGSGFANADQPGFWYSCAVDDTTNTQINTPTSTTTSSLAGVPGPMTRINTTDFPSASGLNPWSAQIGSSAYEAPVLGNGDHAMYGICYDFTLPTNAYVSFWRKEITTETNTAHGFQTAEILAQPATGSFTLQKLLYRKQETSGWTKDDYDLSDLNAQGITTATIFFGVESPGTAGSISSTTPLEQLIAGVSVLSANPHFATQIAIDTPAWGIVLGPDENMWVTEGIGNAIARITLGGVVSHFNVPTANADPGAIAVGTDGNLWFVEFALSLDPDQAQIGRISTTGVITEFPVAPLGAGFPQGVIDRGDGNIWYTLESQSLGNRLSFQNETSGVTGSIAFPGNNAYGVAAGPDGNLYVADVNTSTISRVSGTGGTVQTLQLTPGSGPYDIALGPDGNLWVTEKFSSKIARISPSSFTATEFPTHNPNASPFAITAGKDGNLWFTELALTNNVAYIGRITPGGIVTEYPVPNPGYGIATAPDGSLWFTETAVPAVGRFIPQ